MLFVELLAALATMPVHTLLLDLSSLDEGTGVLWLRDADFEPGDEDVTRFYAFSLLWEFPPSPFF